jgi:hypothetical protein
MQLVSRVLLHEVQQLQWSYCMLYRSYTACTIEHVRKQCVEASFYVDCSIRVVAYAFVKQPMLRSSCSDCYNSTSSSGSSSSTVVTARMQ